MYSFFMSLKQKDGSFLVARHSEVDVRCASYYSSFPLFSNIAQRDLLSPSCRYPSQYSYAGITREHRRVHLLMPDIRRRLCICFASLIFTFWTTSSVRSTSGTRRGPWGLHFLFLSIMGPSTTLLGFAPWKNKTNYRLEESPSVACAHARRRS